jgi:dTDP-4-dehydrorhamnose reductase
VTNIAIIGTQGMLGSAVCRYLSEKNYRILEINSSENTQSNNEVTKFDITQDNLDKLEKDLSSIDFVVNCAGLIKHKIDENSLTSISDLIKINSLFPFELSKLSHKLNFKIIQPATDCVYSGLKGNYSETDAKDPVDLYGYSKVLGEHIDMNLLTLRCSLIGRELSSRLEFLEWVLGHSPENSLKGFTNHHWNGITTLAFAKIVSGLIEGEKFTPGTFHVLPRDSVSKFELAKVISIDFGMTDIKVTKSQSPKAINRTLATNFMQFNGDLWNAAGYNKVPTISEMVKEYSLWVLSA